MWSERLDCYPLQSVSPQSEQYARQDATESFMIACIGRWDSWGRRLRSTQDVDLLGMCVVPVRRTSAYLLPVRLKS